MTSLTKSWKLWGTCLHWLFTGSCLSNVPVDNHRHNAATELVMNFLIEKWGSG